MKLRTAGGAASEPGIENIKACFQDTHAQRQK
jgi:hypothetical protein